MRRICLITIMLCAVMGGMAAQERKVTPVENEDDKPAAPTLHYYDKHGNRLREPVLVWVEDTVVRTSSRPIYPLYNGAEAGFNFFEGILQLAGQSYASYDVRASVSLHNWFFPTVEAGLGFANSKPKNRNFTYKSDPAFFMRIGLDYNFLYNSNPDYRLYVGIRAGFSSFTYDVENISITSDYWDEDNRFSLTGQKASALWGEAVAGLKVKIYKRFSMGWSVRYKFKFKVKDSASGTPWFIPGYGARNAPFTATFSLLFDI